MTIPTSLRSGFGLWKQTLVEWNNEDISRLGAALAFYTLFAIAPLFVIVLAIAGFVFGPEAARHELFGQVAGLMGTEGADAVQAIVNAANKPQAGLISTVVAAGTLFVGATGVFVQLQDSLNLIWHVQRRRGAGIWLFLRDRFLSLGLIVGIGFLLLVSLVVSAGLSAVGKYAAGLLPAQATIWQVLNFGVSFLIIALLFAMIFKVLPDVRIPWRAVWAGATVTSLLFNLGKYLFGLYLGRSSVASAYGAAGSLVVVLMWVYYSAQVLFLGAKFTQVRLARFRPRPGPRIPPGARMDSLLNRSG